MLPEHPDTDPVQGFFWLAIENGQALLATETAPVVRKILGWQYPG